MTTGINPDSLHKMPYTEKRSKLMDDLKTIVELSHEFGTPDYVKGGGGNTSV